MPTWKFQLMVLCFGCYSLKFNVIILHLHKCIYSKKCKENFLFCCWLSLRSSSHMMKTLKVLSNLMQIFKLFIAKESKYSLIYTKFTASSTQIRQHLELLWGFHYYILTDWKFTQFLWLPKNWISTSPEGQLIQNRSCPKSAGPGWMDPLWLQWV